MTAANQGARADARKRTAVEQRWTHHDPGVRDIIRAEVAAAVAPFAALADECDRLREDIKAARSELVDTTRSDALRVSRALIALDRDLRALLAEVSE